MNIETFLRIVESNFFAGVPDSQLKPLCNYLMDKYGIDPKHHIIAANEGNAVALGAGYHLATGKNPVIYMQNSGEGNIVNPVVSLLNKKVYNIPMIFIIGWRGEPGEHDEPQHVFQGEITIKFLEDMDIESYVVSKDTTEEDLKTTMIRFNILLNEGRNVAFVIRKGALDYDGKVEYHNSYSLSREEVIRHIVKVSGTDPIISTTGKASRELFEIREAEGVEHSFDFLTVGSMGHSSSIALGVAVNRPEQKIWCIDGDGALLMHMGAMAVIGSIKPQNLVHILINNEAHETVGGMPTVGSNIDFLGVAKACGYSYTKKVDNIDDLNTVLMEVKERSECCFVEIKCALGSRKDLGRPTTSPIENKKAFMDYLIGTCE